MSLISKIVLIESKKKIVTNRMSDNNLIRIWLFN